MLKGVATVTSGYAGGFLDNPSYQAVSGGKTGHAEVIKVEFDPAVISYATLLEVFFAAHDPTTLNQQGNDVGDQYRSVILYTSEVQRQQAEAYIKELESKGVFPDRVVTDVLRLENFYTAEEYHQNYYQNNISQPYCQIVINPKIKKFKEKYPHLIKEKN